jgi:hypothetical protein
LGHGACPAAPDGAGIIILRIPRNERAAVEARRYPTEDMVVMLSALSGCVWGVIGTYLLTDGRMDARGWGGLVASPLIGIAAGMVAVRFRNPSGVQRIFMPLASLYATAALFALAARAWSAAFDVAPLVQSAAPSISFGQIILDVFMALILLTVGGYVLVLWPLAVVNHHLIWRWISRQSVGGSAPAADRTRVIL